MIHATKALQSTSIWEWTPPSKLRSLNPSNLPPTTVKKHRATSDQSRTSTGPIKSPVSERDSRDSLSVCCWFSKYILRPQESSLVYSCSISSTGSMRRVVVPFVTLRSRETSAVQFDAFHDSDHTDRSPTRSPTAKTIWEVATCRRWMVVGFSPMFLHTKRHLGTTWSTRMTL